MARHHGARLGQHFLRSKSALDTIVRAGEVTPDDLVLEIGPGEGVLTKALLDTGARVIALEKDEELCGALRETFANEIGADRLTLIEGDALDFDPSLIDAGKGYKLIANIPYYITGALLRKFLTTATQPSRMVLLVQKEIAERIARSEKESILSISVKAYGAPRYVAKVSRGSFAPPPKVDSAILLIDTISRTFFNDVDEGAFFEVVRAGFASKRKFLANNLGVKFEKEKVMQALTAAGIDEKERAENIRVGEWKVLTLSLTD